MIMIRPNRKSWIRKVAAALILLVAPVIAMAQIDVSIQVSTPPPPLPVYEQPPIPDEGYLWTPGYWAWSEDTEDYYWVPGTWVQAPQVGFLWTPGYWGGMGAGFLWHAGYWGPTVGFYGGVNYGYGYSADGFHGGYWRGGGFYYNQAVMNVGGGRIHNTYRKPVPPGALNHVSYNGGAGGTHAAPTPEQARAEHEQHLAPTAAQTQHIQTARGDPAFRLSQNHGRPAVAATARPNEFGSNRAMAALRLGRLRKAIDLRCKAARSEPQDS